MEENESFLYPNDTIFVFVDNCPSELFIGDLSGNTVFTVLSFSRFDRRIKPLNQFKNIRAKRRMKVINEFISTLTKKQITIWGHAVINEKAVALQSAKNFLKDNQIVVDDLNLNDNVIFNDHSMTYGKLLCLTWYTICLHAFSIFPIRIANAGGFKQAIALLDLLPGDNADRQNNLAIINLIKESSELKVNNLKDLSIYNVDRFGFGYAKGIDHHLRFDAIKSSHEFCMTDWICHSVFEKFSKNGDKGIASLAEFLIAQGTLKISKDFLIVGANNSSTPHSSP